MRDHFGSLPAGPLSIFGRISGVGATQPCSWPTFGIGFKKRSAKISMCLALSLRDEEWILAVKLWLHRARWSKLEHGLSLHYI